MTVQNDVLDMQSQARRDEAPSLEYRSSGHDSLSMFLAAIGGAILGVLLTLLILAIINGGTLDFTGNARLRSLEGTLSRINENVGTLSSNVDVVAAEIARVQSDLATAQSSVNNRVAAQGAQLSALDQRLAGLGDSLTQLEVTRQRFETFVSALTTALDEVNGK